MIVSAGVARQTPFASRSWQEDSRLRIGAADRAARLTSWVRGICLHTTQGRYPQPLIPGSGTPGSALANVTYWNRSPDYAATHLLIDQDGTVCQTADLVTEQCWHATSVNPVSVGIEVCQGSDGRLYQQQVTVAVALCDWLTELLGIQRQIPQAYGGKPLQRLVDGGKDVVGVYGHRDQTSKRGRGDPGDWLMEALLCAGYERYDLNAGADLAEWKVRQAALGLAQDGIPGPRTVAALKAAGHPDGIWVKR